MLYDTSPPFKISSPMGERKHLEAALKNEESGSASSWSNRRKGEPLQDFLGKPLESLVAYEQPLIYFRASHRLDHLDSLLRSASLAEYLVIRTVSSLHPRMLSGMCFAIVHRQDAFQLLLHEPPARSLCFDESRLFCASIVRELYSHFQSHTRKLQSCTAKFHLVPSFLASTTSLFPVAVYCPERRTYLLTACSAGKAMPRAACPPRAPSATGTGCSGSSSWRTRRSPTTSGPQVRPDSPPCFLALLLAHLNPGSSKCEAQRRSEHVTHMALYASSGPQVAVRTLCRFLNPMYVAFCSFWTTRLFHLPLDGSPST
jgi:hypothetical protein